MGAPIRRAGAPAIMPKGAAFVESGGRKRCVRLSFLRRRRKYGIEATMFDSSIAAKISHLTVAFLPVLLGIILHEVAHGWAALRCGDPTARMLGRLTLNPVPHIDPVGLGVFAFTAMFTPFVFGWAKPVPVNPRLFRNYRRGMLLVSAAGPLTNMLLAMTFAALLRLLLFAPADFLVNTAPGEFLLRMCQVGIAANFTLAWINLLPIPPLDGGHILEILLPGQIALQFQRLERYGFLLLVLLIASGALSAVLMPLIRGSWSFALWVFGI